MAGGVAQAKYCPRIVGGYTARFLRSLLEKIPPEGVDDVPTVSTGTAAKGKTHGGHTVEPG